MPAKTGKRMTIMLIVVAIVIALLVGFNLFRGHMIKQFMASMAAPTATVTATQVEVGTWQPRLDAVATLRAARGADLALDASGVITEIAIASGQEVKAGDLILKLRDDVDRAALNQAQAALALAEMSFTRAQKQIKSHTIAQADFDKIAADLKVKRAGAAQQRALVEKKELRAPFDGRAGIITLSPGAYVNAGTTVVTVQQIDPVYADFHLPQKQLTKLAVGQTVHVSIDGLAGKSFAGRVSAISPKVDPNTRNVMVEARIPNPDGLLQPGMFAHIGIDAGQPQQWLTLPQTAIAYNPYGSTVFVVQEQQAKAKDGTSQTVKVVQQAFVTTGDTRGDQVAILEGLKAGDTVVTSGQMKLKNGTQVRIDNSVVPANDPHPTPVEH